MAEILVSSTDYENEADVNNVSSTSSTTASSTATVSTPSNSTASPQTNVNSPMSSLSSKMDNITSSGNSSCSSNTSSNVNSGRYCSNSSASNNLNLFNENVESSVETTSPSTLSASENGSKDRPSSPAMSIISSKEIAVLTAAQISDRKSSYTSTSTEKTFHRRFNCINNQERLLNYFACALVGEILLQGFLYITENYFAFYSNIFGYKTKIVIPISEVKKVTREKTVRIIPNAVGICTDDEKYVFGSLLSRETTYRVLQEVLSKHISMSSVKDSVKNELDESKVDNEEENNVNRLSSTPKIIINNNEEAKINESSKCKLKLISAIKPNENNIKKPIISDTESDINSSDDTLSLNQRKSITTEKCFNISQLKWMNRRTLLYLSITFALIILLIFSIILLWRINTINKFLTFLSNANNQSYQQSPYFKEEMKRINFELLDKLDELSKLKQSFKELLDSVERLTSCKYFPAADDNSLTKFIGRVDSNDNICAIKI